MGITLNVEQYLKDLEYLVNIDSQSKDPEGVAKVAAFFEKAFGDIGWTVETWAKSGGYQGADDRERIWFSPACINPQAEAEQTSLF